MKITDPISDLLTRIRNGQMAKKEVIAIPASKMKIGITHILREEGFVRNYKCIRDGKQGILKIALKYDEATGHGAIKEIKRVSKSSRRRYVGATEIPYVKNGFGIGLLSTSVGLLTDREARERNVGGEYICSVF